MGVSSQDIDRVVRRSEARKRAREGIVAEVTEYIMLAYSRDPRKEGDWPELVEAIDHWLRTIQ